MKWKVAHVNSQSRETWGPCQMAVGQAGANNYRWQMLDASCEGRVFRYAVDDVQVVGPLINCTCDVKRNNRHATPQFPFPSMPSPGLVLRVCFAARRGGLSSAAPQLKHFGIVHL